ncbi:hypothetical protein KW782_02425 [Candidatus Parcubacteria bacterium]|nr:hypothetical protein [Candidatus Parcubacteria bacterium]
MAQSWTKQKVLDEIQALHKNEGRINTAYVQTKHWRLYQAGGRHFGSWKKAIIAAGFKWSKIKRKGGLTIWTREVIIAKIIEVHSTECRVNSNFMQLHYGSLYQAARKQFGSYKAAVEASGLDYHNVRKQGPTPYWSKSRIAAEIRRRYRNGEQLNSEIIKKAAPGFYKKTRWRFGKDGWAKALRYAGFDPFKIQQLVKWTPKTLTAEIRKLEAEGFPLDFTNIRTHRYDLFMATLKRGGWARAVEAAGIDYLKHCKVWSTRVWLRKLTQADVVKLKRRADELIDLHFKQKRRRKR